ncbi:MAG: sulfite exporter TauE/SafE family protein [Pyrinomonadaceae bacterium]|nr:sulfite exporter TauE/SafE family protein [Pyrinomonadaceae bacterium]
MSTWEFYLIFVLGLVSSLHCVSMCGPIVLAYSLPLGSRKFSGQLVAHLAYNFGRIITYTFLGAIAGFLGTTIGFVGQLAGIENIVAIVAGVLMVFAGLLMLDLLPSKGLQKYNPLLYTTKFLKPLGSKITSSNISSKFMLGLILGYLPCGLIYAALLKSMATGSITAGALTMTAFGLGTAFSLLAIGIFSSAFNLKLSGWGSRLASICVLVLGLLLVYRGVMPITAAYSNKDENIPACHKQ